TLREARRRYPVSATGGKRRRDVTAGLRPGVEAVRRARTALARKNSAPAGGASGRGEPRGSGALWRRSDAGPASEKPDAAAMPAGQAARDAADPAGGQPAQAAAGTLLAVLPPVRAGEARRHGLLRRCAGWLPPDGCSVPP